MQVTIIRIHIHALQLFQHNTNTLSTPHLSFDLERDLLLRFSFLSLSLSLSLCRSLSRLHGSGARPHDNTRDSETHSAARGEGGAAYRGLGLPIMICVGHVAGGYLLWQCLQGTPRKIATYREQDYGQSYLMMQQAIVSRR